MTELNEGGVASTKRLAVIHLKPLRARPSSPHVGYGTDLFSDQLVLAGIETWENIIFLRHTRALNERVARAREQSERGRER